MLGHKEILSLCITVLVFHAAENPCLGLRDYCMALSYNFQVLIYFQSASTCAYELYVCGFVCFSVVAGQGGF